jgi:hypothetical protein
MIEIPEIMKKAADESKLKTNKGRFSLGVIKGIDIYWQDMNKEVFASKCHMNPRTCRKIYLAIQQYKVENEIKECSDEDYEIIQKGFK